MPPGSSDPLAEQPEGDRVAHENIPGTERSKNRASAILLVVAVAVLGGLWATGHVRRFALLWLGVLVPSIILHEVAHGAVAYALGDDTAKRAGRLTLNPVRHMDPFGTVVLPTLLLALNGPAFGWARPVPVRVDRLRHPRNSSFVVGLAGPVTNLILLVICAAGWVLTSSHITGSQVASNSGPVGPQLLLFGGIANAYLALFNLLPVPPLDGSALLERVLPVRALPSYYRFRNVGLAVLVVVVFWLPWVRSGLFDVAVSMWSHLSSL